MIGSNAEEAMNHLDREKVKEFVDHSTENLPRTRNGTWVVKVSFENGSFKLKSHPEGITLCGLTPSFDCSGKTEEVVCKWFSEELEEVFTEKGFTSRHPRMHDGCVEFPLGRIFRNAAVET